MKFLVTAFDAEGRQAETSGSWIYPGETEQRGRLLAALEIAGRVEKATAEKEVYYIDDYVLVPPEKVEELVGYRVRVQGRLPIGYSTAERYRLETGKGRVLEFAGYWVPESKGHLLLVSGPGGVITLNPP